jgi:phosphate transport system permease protein
LAEVVRPPLSSTADRAASVALAGVALGVAAVFVWIVGDLAISGARALDLDYLLTAPIDAGRAGGVAPILVSNLLILAVCMAAALPLGLGAALWLSEVADRQFVVLPTIRASLDVLAGVPSIVFGLFGNALFCHALGMGFSILSGGLTLACMVLPIFIRQTEAGLQAIPVELRRSAYALGLSRSATLFRLVLPRAAPAIAVGFTLGVGRALAETAALIFTSGYVDRMPGSVLDSGRSLSIHIYDLATNVAGGDERAYAAALVLVVLLLVINTTAARIAASYRRRTTT